MTLATNAAPTIDPAWLAELTAELATYGYKVTKARAPRAGTSTESAPIGRADGCTPAKAPKGHTHCAEHWRVPGMRKPVCIVPQGLTIREDGRDTGELVPAEWTDTDTVLAFAVDVGARTEAHRTRASIGYVGADQSGAVLPFGSTFDAEKAERERARGRMRQTPHAFDGGGKAYAYECTACGLGTKASAHEAAA